jgi:2-polyprenyl-6-methoxyphenol hydroxylase-like FAD-dependent oxidoreductase
MDTQKKFTIAIVYVPFTFFLFHRYLKINYSGGGIGGLGFAVAISKICPDIDVYIYESAPSFSEVGAGIGVWPRVWDTLKTLGLEDDLKSKYTSLGGKSILFVCTMVVFS